MMPYEFLVFLHVGSMFLATALAIGPSTMLFLIARSRDRGTIKRAFGVVAPVFRLGGLAYGLGIVFGLLTAASGSIALTTPWLITSYLLVVLLIATNLVFERWTRAVANIVAAEDVSQEAIDRIVSRTAASASLTGMILITLGLVFVMVVKPTLVA
jgi:hypothetical protein